MTAWTWPRLVKEQLPNCAKADRTSALVTLAWSLETKTRHKWDWGFWGGGGGGRGVGTRGG